MTTVHTCDHCNCPKCLVQRAGRDNPAIQAALQQAWADEPAAWGIPSNTGDTRYLTEYAEEYPANFYGAGNVPVQRAYHDPANPLNCGVDRYPRQASRPILGIIPRRRPADALEWFIVGTAGTVVLAIIGTVWWIGYQMYELTQHTGAYLAAHGTQIFSAVMTVALVGLLVMAAASGGSGKGGGRGFSGTFTGRMH